MSSKNYHHAIVMGGSIAGLLAARALADFFEQVTVIERDPMPAMDHPRKGVPQGNHAHILLKAGQEIIERWFPGITDEIVANGALRQDFGESVRWFLHGSWKPRFTCGFDAIYQSRYFLEWHIRTRTMALPNVTFCYNASVSQFLSTPDHSRINGVLLQTPGGNMEAVYADLIVDTTGRGSRTVQWLEALGYPAPPVMETKIDLTYVSRFYENAVIPQKGTALGVYGLPPHLNRAGIILPIENGRQVASYFFYGDQEVPKDDDSFLAFAQTLSQPDMYMALKNATPISEIKTFKFPAMIRRRYDQMARFPEGLVMLGDATRVFDPVLGQGMSMAAKEAVLLHKMLQKSNNLDGLGQHFHQQLSRNLELFWRTSVAEVWRYPTTTGYRPALAGGIQWYLRQVMNVSNTDNRMYTGFLRVMHLLDSPVALFKPGIVFKVLRHALTHRKTPAAQVRSTQEMKPTTN